MKKRNTTFWVNYYGNNGRLMSSTPHETKESAKIEVECFLTVAEYFPHKYAKVEGRDCWVDENGRRIAIEGKGDYKMHIYHTLVAIMANYRKFDELTAEDIRDLAERIIKAKMVDDMEKLVQRWADDDAALLLFRILF